MFYVKVSQYAFLQPSLFFLREEEYSGKVYGTGDWPPVPQRASALTYIHQGGRRLGDQATSSPSMAHYRYRVSGYPDSSSPHFS